jgi:bis(5'-nucleosidyl)-tetraphosphatase
VEITVVYKGILLGEIVGDVLPGEDGPHGVKRLLAENFSAVAAKIFELADGRFWAEITCSVENLPDRGQTPCNKPAPSAPPVLQYDKVCGAVVFRRGGPRRYIIIENLSGHIGFPKGHCEDGETEEMTAVREVREETGLEIELLPGFRCESHYTAEVDGEIIEKTAVYFLAAVDEEAASIQEEEIPDWWTLPYEEALVKLNFESDRNILRRAQYYCI